MVRQSRPMFQDWSPFGKRGEGMTPEEKAKAIVDSFENHTESIALLETDIWSALEDFYERGLEDGAKRLEAEADAMKAEGYCDEPGLIRGLAGIIRALKQQKED